MSLVGPHSRLLLLGGLIFLNFTCNIHIIEHCVDIVDTCLSVYCLGHVQLGGPGKRHMLL